MDRESIFLCRSSLPTTITWALLKSGGSLKRHRGHESRLAGLIDVTVVTRHAPHLQRQEATSMPRPEGSRAPDRSRGLRTAQRQPRDMKKPGQKP